MKRLDRVRLIEAIAQRLQSEMTTSDIVSYLGAFGIKTGPYQGAVPSKRVFVKELLATEPDDLVFKIADEFDLDRPQVEAVPVATSKFWRANHFRLFISHTNSNKEICSKLAAALAPFNISGFVAHVDIEPTLEWQNEIEAALSSMDALLAIITPDFVISKWTDQEVGFAIGRDVLVVPVRKGADPHGFIGKYQGLQSRDMSVKEVADAIFQIVSTNNRSRQKFLDAIISHISNSGDESSIVRMTELLGRIENVPLPAIERLRTNAITNENIAAKGAANDTINQVLKNYGLSAIPQRPTSRTNLDEDIPF